MINMALFRLNNPEDVLDASKQPLQKLTKDVKDKMKKHLYLLPCMAVIMFFFSCFPVISFASAPVYQGTEYCVINNGEPEFVDEEITDIAYIEYEPLDKWQRASKVMACLGPETLEQAGRSSMQNILPSGWQTSTYDFIPGLNLFQRCHLVGDQLGGEERIENLVTGTQYLNIVGMLPIENQVAEYIKRTGNHVMYRAWPYYIVGNLVCEGVQIEVMSVEDEEIRINGYCFNVQPGVHIDYRTGANGLSATSAELDYVEQTDSDLAKTVMSNELTYVLNTNTKRFHDPSCPSCSEMNAKNMQETTLSRDELIDMGYKPCGRCNP